MTFAQYLSVNNNENLPNNNKIHFIKLDPQFCLLLNLIVKIIQDFLISQSGKKMPNLVTLWRLQKTF